MSESSDLELVQRCLSGECSAVRELIERFERPVFALCLRMLRQRQDAEDVAQESLVRMCRHLSSWDVSRQLLPWVLAIAANRCRTALDRRSRQPLVPESLAEAVVQPGPVPAELGEELERALCTLREDQRTCFSLFYEQQLSIREIADVLKVAEGTIKTWLHRSRKQLADYLRLRGFE